MHWEQPPDGFHFHNDMVFHDQVDSVTEFQPNAVVMHRQWNFRLNSEATLNEVVREARSIGTLE